MELFHIIIMTEKRGRRMKRERERLKGVGWGKGKERKVKEGEMKKGGKRNKGHGFVC